MQVPPATVIATSDDLLAIAIAANVVALYRSRLPRDPRALSKPLEVQVILRMSNNYDLYVMLCRPSRFKLHHSSYSMRFAPLQRYARPLCLALLVLVVAWNVARARVASRKRKAGAADSGLTALLGGGKRSAAGLPGSSSSAFGGLSDATEDTLSPEQLAALLGGDDLAPSAKRGSSRRTPSRTAADSLLGAGFGVVPPDRPLQPHELAALLGAAGYGREGWSSGDETCSGDDAFDEG